MEKIKSIQQVSGKRRKTNTGNRNSSISIIACNKCECVKFRRKSP
jgi:hypothetical protein